MVFREKAVVVSNLDHQRGTLATSVLQQRICIISQASRSMEHNLAQAVHLALASEDNLPCFPRHPRRKNTTLWKWSSMVFPSQMWFRFVPIPKVCCGYRRRYASLPDSSKCLDVVPSLQLLPKSAKLKKPWARPTHWANSALLLEAVKPRRTTHDDACSLNLTHLFNFSSHALACILPELVLRTYTLRRSSCSLPQFTGNL